MRRSVAAVHTVRARRVASFAAGLMLIAGCSGDSASKTAVSTSPPKAETTAAGQTTAAAQSTAAPVAADTTAAGSTDSSAASPVTTEAAPPETTAAPAIEGGDITVGLGSEPPTLDPASNSLSLENGSIYEAVFDRLMEPGDLGGEAPPKPMLLESLTESADRLTWTMKVRPGVTFHDGTPFDGAAIKFNLDRQKASIYNGAALALATSIDVVDPATVEVKLSQPWTGFPTAMTTVVGYMAAPSAFADGKDGQRNPIGTGPFSFVEWVPGSHVEVAKNAKFWGTPAIVDTIQYKFVPDESARYTALESKSLDAMTTITETRAKQAEEDGFAVIAPPPNGFGFTMYNVRKEPLSDVRVRQALSLSSDRDALAEAFDGDDYSEAGFGAYPPGNRWFAAPENEQKFDPERAEELLAEYGKPVKFTFILLAGDPTITDGVRATIDYWKEVGIDATLELIPDLTTYVTRVFSGDFEVAGWIGGTSREPDATYYNTYRTGGSSNYMGYSNPALDVLLDEGRISTDDARRKEIYAEVQQILRRDLPTAVSSHGKIRILFNAGVTADPAVFFPARTVRRTS